MRIFEMNRLTKILLIVAGISVFMNLMLFFANRMTRADETPVYHPFEVNYNVSLKSLRKKGYDPTKDKNAFLQKYSKDTLIYYQFEYHPEKRKHNNRVLSRHCVIELANGDSTSVAKLVEHYGGLVISSFHRVASKSRKFFVRHKFNKTVFECFLFETGKDKFKLEITVPFPSNEKYKLYY